MAIQYEIEDGTGKADATSYASVAFIKQYWENIRYDFSTLTDLDFQAWGNKATKTLEGMYVNLWPGTRYSTSQSLSWPREDAIYFDETEIDDDVVPIEVQNATAEMVYILSTGADIQPLIDKGGNIIEYSVSVEGAVKESTTYSEGSSFLNRDIYLSVEDALSRILGGVSSQYTLSVQRV